MIRKLDLRDALGHILWRKESEIQIKLKLNRDSDWSE